MHVMLLARQPVPKLTEFQLVVGHHSLLSRDYLLAK
jgi:hypothetical protein